MISFAALMSVDTHMVPLKAASGIVAGAATPPLATVAAEAMMNPPHPTRPAAVPIVLELISTQSCVDIPENTAVTRDLP